MKYLICILLSFLFLNINAQTDEALAAKVIESVHNYLMAYNESDAGKKIDMINRSFHHDGYVYTPTRKLDIEGLFEMAGSFHEEYRMELIGEPEVQHNFVRFAWKYSEKASGGKLERSGFL